MYKPFKIVGVMLLVGLLILIRIFEADLFYDPLISFFKLDHSTEQLPQFNASKLVGSMALRFIITTAISIGVLWLLFNKRDILKVAGLLYLVLFVILIVVFVLLIQSSESAGHMALFYVRRFLIQPIFLLLLIPAFYFQKKA